MKCESIAEIPHDIVAICPEADDDRCAAINEDPDWDRALRRDLSGIPDQENSSEGPNGVADVVGAMSKGRHSRGEHLQKGVEVLSLVVEVRGVHVDLLDIFGKEVVLGFLVSVELLGDDVAVYAMEEVVFGFGEEIAGRVPRGGVEILESRLSVGVR